MSYFESTLELLEQLNSAKKVTKKLRQYSSCCGVWDCVDATVDFLCAWNVDEAATLVFGVIQAVANLELFASMKAAAYDSQDATGKDGKDFCMFPAIMIMLLTAVSLLGLILFSLGAFYAKFAVRNEHKAIRLVCSKFTALPKFMLYDCPCHIRKHRHRQGAP
jgi:hypothetical protein